MGTSIIAMISVRDTTVGSRRAASTRLNTAESFTVRPGMILMDMKLLVKRGRIAKPDSPPPKSAIEMTPRPDRALLS